MKVAISALLTRRLFGRSQDISREIDEEFRFHLELLAEKHLQQDMSVEEANAAAASRFGNVEQIKEQCLAISRQGHPFLVGLKSFLILMFLSGLAVRFFSTELNFHHLGDLLIVVPILGRVLLYVRGLDPASFLSKSQTTSPLGLNHTVKPLFRVYDQGMLTPVERLISDK